MTVTRLIYYSENVFDPGQGSVVRGLRDILSAADRNNRARGLTGALIFDDQWFLQILEGEREAVWRMFERIREDERHDKVILVEMRETEERTFGNWWMGLATRNARTEATFAPFMSDGRFDPRRMSSGHMLELAVALAKLGFRRELAAPMPSDGALSPKCIATDFTRTQH